MSRLPDSFDPSVFVGREVWWVSFGRYRFDLQFVGSPLGLAVEGEFAHQIDGAREVFDFPLAHSRLVQLPGRTVVRASARGTELSLEFDGGQILTLWESGGHESYHLLIGDEEIHV